MPKKLPPFDKGRYIQCALDILNIGMWKVSLSEADEVDDDENVGGICVTQARYRMSDITIRNDITDENELRNILLHEVLHIPHATVDYAVHARIIGDNFSGKFNKTNRLTELYSDAMEPFIVLMTDALRPFVDALYDKPQKRGKDVK